MASAKLYISLQSMVGLLQLPDYLEVTSIYLDPIGGRLEVGVESPVIPEGTEEIRPSYKDDVVETVGENPARFRRLIGIELISDQAYTG